MVDHSGALQHKELHVGAKKSKEKIYLSQPGSLRTGLDGWFLQHLAGGGCSVDQCKKCEAFSMGKANKSKERIWAGQPGPVREPVLVLVVAVAFVDIVHWTSENKYFHWEKLIGPKRGYMGRPTSQRTGFGSSSCCYWWLQLTLWISAKNVKHFYGKS